LAPRANDTLPGRTRSILLGKQDAGRADRVRQEAGDEAVKRWISIPVALVAVLAAGYLARLAIDGSGTGDAAREGSATGAAPGPARAPDLTAGEMPASVRASAPVPVPEPVPSPVARGPEDGTGDPVDPAEAAEAERIAEAMRKLIRDLEYTKGLREPPQQTVEPQPEPWRADPAREGPPPEVVAVAPLRGRATGGERVEIRGKNLRVVSVMFGTSPARLLEASGTLVAVEAPPGIAGPATVAVTNDDGTWGVAPQPYVYAE
jgi:hypothetical protein